MRKHCDTCGLLVKGLGICFRCFWGSNWIPKKGETMEDTSFLEKENGIREENKEQLQQLTLMCNHLNEKRKDIAYFEEQLKKLKNEEKQLSQEEIPNWLLSKGISSITLENGQAITIKEKVYITLPKKDKEKRIKVMKWIIENGGANIIKRVLSIEEPEIKTLQVLKENNVFFEDKKDINGNTLKAWITGKLGMSKNSIQEIEISDVPKEAGLFVLKETKIK